jgi:hypothetical protein
MTIFDLLFLAICLASIATLLFAAGYAVASRRTRAVRVLQAYLVCVAVYLGLVLLVSLVRSQRTLRIGETLCFDDWCITVDRVEQSPSASDGAYVVNLRLSSRALRVTQRENNLAVYMTDSRGYRYDPVPRSSDIPLNVQLGPGDSVLAARTFKVPLDASELGLVIAHEGGFPIEWFIIGSGPFRKPPIVQLPSPTSQARP